jgi:hypothetical protein
MAKDKRGGETSRKERKPKRKENPKESTRLKP